MSLAKKLEWVEKNGVHRAAIGDSTYRIKHINGEYSLDLDGSVLRINPYIDECFISAQEDAESIVRGYINPDLHVLDTEKLLEVIKLAMSEQEMNHLVPTLIHTPEDVLVKALLLLNKDKV